jgi:hypothetical protein
MVERQFAVIRTFTLLIEWRVSLRSRIGWHQEPRWHSGSDAHAATAAVFVGASEGQQLQSS